MGLFSSDFRAMEITYAHGISPPQYATKDKRKRVTVSSSTRGQVDRQTCSHNLLDYGQKPSISTFSLLASASVSDTSWMLRNTKRINKVMKSNEYFSCVV